MPWWSSDACCRGSERPQPRSVGLAAEPTDFCEIVDRVSWPTRAICAAGMTQPTEGRRALRMQAYRIFDPVSSAQLPIRRGRTVKRKKEGRQLALVACFPPMIAILADVEACHSFVGTTHLFLLGTDTA